MMTVEMTNEGVMIVSEFNSGSDFVSSGASDSWKING